MKTVKAIRWRDKGRGLGLEVTDPLFDTTLFFRNHRFFQVHKFFLILLGITLTLALFDKLGRVLSLTLLIYTLLLYFRTQKQAQGLSYSRKHPEQASELDTVQIQYDIYNSSPFPIDSLVIDDSCSVAQNSHQVLAVNEQLKPKDNLSGTYRKKCDGGMGVRAMGPSRAWISDPYGLHEFHILEESEEKIEVYPKLEPVTDPFVQGSHESHFFGVYDVPVRGQSVNFIGIRDYAPGDSLRQISWKLSAKHRKLLVKEFEKAVNAEITLVLNMRADLQMGFGSQSTWEKAKDLTLALMANQAKTGNSVQLLSNELYLPFGHGDGHIHDTVLRVFDCFPKTEFPRRDPLDGMLDLIPPYSTVFYVSPILNQGHDFEWKNLLLLTEKHVALQCYFIDSASFIVGQIQGDYKFAEGIASDETQRNLNSAVDLLNRSGADVFVIRMQDSFTHALAKKVRPMEIRP